MYVQFLLHLHMHVFKSDVYIVGKEIPSVFGSCLKVNPINLESKQGIIGGETLNTTNHSSSPAFPMLRFPPLNSVKSKCSHRGHHSDSKRETLPLSKRQMKTPEIDHSLLRKCLSASKMGKSEPISRRQLKGEMTPDCQTMKLNDNLEQYNLRDYHSPFNDPAFNQVLMGTYLTNCIPGTLYSRERASRKDAISFKDSYEVRREPQSPRHQKDFNNENLVPDFFQHDDGSSHRKHHVGTMKTSTDLFIGKFFQNQNTVSKQLSLQTTQRNSPTSERVPLSTLDGNSIHKSRVRRNRQSPSPKRFCPDLLQPSGAGTHPPAN